MVFLLVHSPLVGPSTWLPVARELERRGHRSLVPTLTGVADAPPPLWRYCVASVRDNVGTSSDPIVLVGHSGAGLLLPAIAAACNVITRRLIFVDSALPERTGETPVVPDAFLAQIVALAVKDRLPPWSSWWGDGAMRQLVPAATQRNRLTADMPSLPLAYARERIPSPPGWERVPCSYLLLSEAYSGAAAAARLRGWRVEAIAGAQHLHMVVAPEAVTEALLRLAS